MTPVPSVLFGPDILERMVQAVQRVQERLHRATKALEDAGVPYAVVGGHAVAAWVARANQGGARNTPDVNILLRRADLPGATAAFSKAGFVHFEADGAPTFRDGPTAKPRDAIHIIFAGEKVHPDDLLSAPDVTTTGPRVSESYQVVDLEELVQMKLLANRLKDKVHIQDMIGVGLIDASWPARFPAELGARLQVLLDDPNG